MNKFKFSPNQSQKKQAEKKDVSYSSTPIDIQQDEKKVKTTGPFHNPKYKLKLCEKFEADGLCPYFEKCQFAHGVEELEKWVNRQKRILAKAENPQQTFTKSPATPQSKSKSNYKTENGIPFTLNNSTVSPFIAPEKAQDKSINKIISPSSKKPYFPVQQSSTESRNPWFSKTAPPNQTSRLDPPKLSIDSMGNDYTNPARQSLNSEEENDFSNTMFGKENINSFDEEKMLRELEKMVSENKNDKSSFQQNQADDIRINSILFNQGYLQVPSNSSYPASAENPMQYIGNTWRNESSYEGYPMVNSSQQNQLMSFNYDDNNPYLANENWSNFTPNYQSYNQYHTITNGMQTNMPHGYNGSGNFHHNYQPNA